MIGVNSIYKQQINFIGMESGTILHLALLRKISNLSSNPNYRERLHQLRRAKPSSENDSAFRKHAEFPLLEIANRQDNCACLSNKKRQRKSFFQQNTTISAWSVNAEEPAIEQLRYREQNRNKAAKKEKKSRKNHSFVTFSNQQHLLSKQNQHPLSKQNQDLIRKQKQRPTANCLGRRRQLASKHKYSLLKHVSFHLQQDYSVQLKQESQEPLISQKLSSFQAFVAQAKLRAKATKQ